MNIRRISRPSPAMAVAVAALVVAMTGTAVAATLVSGDSLIKKTTLSGNRLRSHTITGAQVDLTKLGTVPNAKTAATAKALPPLIWHNFTLINGWADYYTAPDPRAPAFAVDAQRIVHLRGAIKCPLATCLGPQFATVSSFYRPTRNVYLISGTFGGTTFGRVTFDTAGAVTSTGTSTNPAAFTGLDGLTYVLG